jgi:hypothetical protein
MKENNERSNLHLSAQLLVALIYIYMYINYMYQYIER